MKNKRMTTNIYAQIIKRVNANLEKKFLRMNILKKIIAQNVVYYQNKLKLH